MNILYMLIPLGLVLLGIAVWAFMWAVRSGQFDDLEGPAHRILMDDDEKRHYQDSGEAEKVEQQDSKDHLQDKD